MKLFVSVLFMSIVYLLISSQFAHPDNISSCVSKDGVLDKSCAEMLLSKTGLAMESFYDELLSELTRHHQQAIENPAKHTPPPLKWYARRLELLTQTFEDFLRYKQRVCDATQLEFKFGSNERINYYRCQIEVIEHYHEMLLKIYRPEILLKNNVGRERKE